MFDPATASAEVPAVFSLLKGFESSRLGLLLLLLLERKGRLKRLEAEE